MRFIGKLSEVETGYIYCFKHKAITKENTTRKQSVVPKQVKIVETGKATAVPKSEVCTL